MKAFVTGGSGFVGGNLIEMLVKRGHTVRALARSGKALDAVSRVGAEPVEGELADVKALCAGISESETVFHCAGAMEFWNEEQLQERLNVEGTRNVTFARELFLHARKAQAAKPIFSPNGEDDFQGFRYRLARHTGVDAGSAECPPTSGVDERCAYRSALAAPSFKTKTADHSRPSCFHWHTY